MTNVTSIWDKNNKMNKVLGKISQYNESCTWQSYIQNLSKWRISLSNLIKIKKTVPTPTQYSAWSASLSWYDKRRKKMIQIKKKILEYLYLQMMRFFTQKTVKSVQKIPRTINTFIKMVEYKIKIQKLVAFLYNNGNTE